MMLETRQQFCVKAATDSQAAFMRQLVA